MPRRRKLTKGIYADKHGISVIYQRQGKPIETRFDPGTPLDRLIRWRRTQIGMSAATAPRDPRGSLARDVVRYLKRLKGLPGYSSEKAHLRAWLQAYPTLKRWQLTRERVELAVADWRQAGYAARTIRHRLRVLEALFHRLDGPRAETPCDDVTPPPKPRPRPVSVSEQVIADVARRLRIHEMPGIGRLRDAKTRARFLVLATTGRRPAEVKRAQREDLDLHRRIWLTRTAKGGINTALILNDEMIAAWQLFIAAGAWGEYDDRSFAKTLRRNGWPKGIRPYNLRHSTAIALRARGADLGDVKDHLGHASIRTAEEFYLHAVPDRMAAVSATLAGRFPPAIFQAAEFPRPAPMIRARRDAKAQEKTRDSDTAVQRSGRRR